MPRYDKQSINAPTAPDHRGPSVGLDVAASPVDLGVRARGGDTALALADSLRGLVPGLAQFGAQRAAEQKRLDSIEGTRARHGQADNSLMPTLKEQTPEFQAAYMRQHGLMMGIEDATALQADFEAEMHKPGFNPDKFLGERRSALISGMSDPEAFAAYTTHLTRVESQLRGEFAKKTLVDTRKNAAAGVSAEITEVQRLSEGADPNDTIASYNTVIARHSALGTPKDVITGMWVNALVNNPHALPQDFDHLRLKDASGYAPEDRVDGSGQPYKVVIDRAREAAIARENKITDTLMDDGVRDFMLKHEEILRTNPMSITDPAEYVRQNAKAWPGHKEVGPALAKILKAQDDFKENQFYDAAAAGSLPFSHALATQPKFVQAAERRHMARWAKADWSNPASINALLSDSTNDFNRHGVPDPFIASMADRVHAMSTVKGPDGAETLSPEFRAMHSLWKVAKDTNSAALGLFKEDAQIFLQAFNDWPGTETEKFQAAKQAVSRDAKEARKGMQGDARAVHKKAIINDLDSWLKEGVQLGTTPANADVFADRILDRATILMARGGSLTWKQAIEVSKTMSFATHAWDGNKTFVEIPADLPKGKATEYLSQYLADAKEAFSVKGKELPGYKIIPEQHNGKPAFRMTDLLGNTIAPARTHEELAHLSAKAKGVLPSQIAALQNQRMDEREGAATQNRAIGQLSPEESAGAGEQATEVAAANAQVRREKLAEERREDALRNLAIGQLSPEEFRAEITAIQKEEAAIRDAKAKSATEAAAQIPVLPKADAGSPSLTLKVPQPRGPEETPKDIATARAKSDPSTALTAYGEGYHNFKFDDPNGRHKLLGFGYNLSTRSEAEVRADLKRAGVTDERMDKVLNGTGAITPDEAARLSRNVRTNSVRVAQKVLGDAAWAQLPDHKRAVLIDLAYQTGDYSDSFRSALRNLQRKSDTGVKRSLQVTYLDSKTNERKIDHRRNELRLAMWESPERFLQLVNQGK